MRIRVEQGPLDAEERRDGGEDRHRQTDAAADCRRHEGCGNRKIDAAARAIGEEAGREEQQRNADAGDDSPVLVVGEGGQEQRQHRSERQRRRGPFEPSGALLVRRPEDVQQGQRPNEKAPRDGFPDREWVRAHRRLRCT